ncbi:MAG: iron ABC transporter permease [Acidobacteriota bacterium]|nr:iron ABC transporter permease [Acidobacteriota bacterium]
MASVVSEAPVVASYVRPWRAHTVLFLIMIAVGVGSLMLGSYHLSLHDMFQAALHPNPENEASIVLWQVRLPRLLAASLVGGGLALAGAAYQGLFNNPMVSPDILGASAGSGFGAALGILLGWHIVRIECAAFVMGLIAVGLAWMLGALLGRRGDPVLMLVLVGILVASVFAALISFTKYMADPYDRLQAITFWLMGSFASINFKDVKLSAVPILLGAVPLLLLRWRLNVLCMGEEEARALGVNTRVLRFIVILAATLISSATVSICGMVGWIGLVVPHLARMIVGPNYRAMIPAAALIGVSFLLLVDDVARTIGTLEMPIGILTALIGAPFFLFLLVRQSRSAA